MKKGARSYPDTIQDFPSRPATFHISHRGIYFAHDCRNCPSCHLLSFLFYNDAGEISFQTVGRQTFEAAEKKP
jgi:hypothetical protein